MKVIVTFGGGKDSLASLLWSSFFSSDKIPSRFYKGSYPLIGDVVRYVRGKYLSGSLFDDDNVATSCMSYYELCE